MELPVVPAPATRAPWVTCCPTLSPMLARWLYVVWMPLPWSMTMRFPPPYGLHPASVTVPVPAANTSVLQVAARSKPVCSSPLAPESGLDRNPKGELTVMLASGGRKVVEGVSGAVVAGAGDAGCTSLVWAWAGAFEGAGLLLMAGAAKLSATSLLAVTCGWFFSIAKGAVESKVSGLWATPA